ncbi:MAG: hypothetical protein WCK13_10215 [Ignavibacteriota bacterium]|nr:hypothetical protein [Ignavibacteriota bacterium]
MSTLNNSNSNSNSKSIYDITHKIEEELTYIYEMRMKQYINPSADKDTLNGNVKSNEVVNNNRTVSVFAR